MRLSEALRLVRANQGFDGPPTRISLICGFMPLQLETLTCAYARLRLPHSRIEMVTGLYGDIEGTLLAAADQGGDGAIVLLEWMDLDARLGLRASPGWTTATVSDITQQLEARFTRLAGQMVKLAASMPVVVVPPTLTLPPITHVASWQAHPEVLRWRSMLASFLEQIGSNPGVRILDTEELDRRSAQAERHNVKLELHGGFPYSTPHAAVIAEVAIDALFQTPRRKALITDLDDTLWRGILGDVGVEGISSNLTEQTQHHALYQQLLASLAETGVLIGVASKNDPALVEQAFARPDLLLPRSMVFPIEASWGTKSAAISRILQAWNIGADSVVFVDDSPMELAEAAAAHPALRCMRFPTSDAAAAVELFRELRQMFGKLEIQEEDRVRLESLRRAAVMQPVNNSEASAEFVASLNARVEVAFSSDQDVRAFELVNKTNQFNLNGRRYIETEWRSFLREPGAFLLTVSYADRFGPLGKIAVVAGHEYPDRVSIDTWVMSCRVFSRHIEFRTIERLFQLFGLKRLEFGFVPTERNGPTVRLFERLVGSPLPAGGIVLTPSQFAATAPVLYDHAPEHTHE
jgi:FkbH-like protein